MTCTDSMPNSSPNTLAMIWFYQCTSTILSCDLTDRNTGAEAVETGIKLVRRWGYMKKRIPSGQAIVFSVQGNFHGRTTGVVSMSTDPESRDKHGPYLPLVGAIDPTTGKVIRYNHIEDLEESFERHSANIAGLIIEPIQGEAG